jgi:hypothetical protein
MHDEQPDHTAIELARAAFLVQVDELDESGVQGVDIAIGMMFAAHALATVLKGGNMAAAIEWMRDAVDLQERQLLERPQT